MPAPSENRNGLEPSIDKSGTATMEKGPKKAGVTYAGQAKLPKLPIPDLKATTQKYLTALKPLQSESEHAETQSAVEDFLVRDGPILNKRLQKYATGQTSYIEQFWYDSYLNFDNPVVLNLNPFFLLEDDPTPARANQVTRAASLVVSALCFVRAVRKEELPPDMIKENPLCMYQYSKMFSTARVPTENGCHIGQDDGAKHLVVLVRGQFYWFDVLDENHDLIMNEKDLAVNLQTIVDDASELPVQEAAKGALGVLSTENRKVWAGLREVLTRDKTSNNAECLATVDSALFILCLDDTEPANAADLCQNMLCGTSEIERGVQTGTCTNRWYDKLQIIVCKNGSAGINFEHTGIDGHTVLRFASDVYTDTILRYAKSINGKAPSLWTSQSPDPSKRDPESFGNVSITPHKLEWDMVPELRIALRFAETRLADLLHQNEFAVMEFQSYGSNFIKSMGFSPDAFTQMVFQAAYYGLYGRVECTYEPAMTKAFFHGRTDAIRSVTEESVEFVKTFWGENPAEDKVKALQKATKRHTEITRECSKGLGQDRHLYALYCIWQRGLDDGSYPPPPSTSSPSPHPNGQDGGTLSQVLSSGNKPETDRRSRRDSMDSTQAIAEMNMPHIFADGGWDKLNTTILSTSNCGNPSLRQFGFGPVSLEGFGIGYIIKEDSISVCVSSKHRQTQRFVDAIERYLLEIRRVMRAAKKQDAKTKTPIQGGSRAREAEERREKETRLGRSVAGNLGESVQQESEEEEDDGLDGYGFFDAGMLLSALKANKDDKMKASEKASVEAKRSVGKKLTINDD